MKKIMLMALSVAALAAFALPAAASAHWTHNGIELKTGENATISFTGEARFAGEVGGINCLVDGMATFVGGTTTGRVDSFTTDGEPTDVCQTTGLLFLLGCEVEEVEATELPWTLHWDSTSEITITTGRIDNRLAECPIAEINLEPGTVTANVAEAEMNAIKKFTLSGTLETNEEEPVGVSGSLNLTEGSGTYGI